ncbi:Signal sequence peptidase I, SEC11 [Methanocaldococcus lauensis]|nr:Signal sequence peptidase I, SEC11 [Methanocaldococcus lauensis]
MYPIMKRGDLVVVENAGFEFNPKDVKVGDIVVYKAHWPYYQSLLYSLDYKLGLNPIKTLQIFNETTTNKITVKYLGKLKTNNGYYDIVELDIPKSPTKPVIHRVIEKVNFDNKTYFIIKGDNNPINDPELVNVNQIRQRVVVIDGHPLVIPYIGYLSIWLKEYWYIVVLFIVLYYLYSYLRGGR